jgi:hypothetical protein
MARRTTRPVRKAVTHATYLKLPDAAVAVVGKSAVRGLTVGVRKAGTAISIGTDHPVAGTYVTNIDRPPQGGDGVAAGDLEVTIQEKPKAPPSSLSNASIQQRIESIGYGANPQWSRTPVPNSERGRA